MSRYVEIDTRAEVEIDLYDIIDDIVELYLTDKKFRKEIDDAKDPQKDLDRLELLDQLKTARKDVIIWDRLKPDLEEMMKDDYVVVL